LIIICPKQAALFTQKFDSFLILSLICRKLLVQSLSPLFYLEFIPLKGSEYFVFGEYYPFNAERLIKTSQVSPLKIKIPSKNMREKPTNATIIYSVF
jgi:hypothetical protein